ncbi:carotenoid biosynthesis protein [Mangrovivirga cuniculi]|uniref:Carotenoid biosynthesis protein n=1 Tax=Mangrovivirga cuniculi TaxID=2715131 RepID=A0A4D7JZR6_9BACT|nr:carotenoid biosynthesis protein [Mangrovivirga cuniculi]QCK14154.1 hypothetical protein DCC35_05040 [Mangrovivirga cuniculi]
MKAKEEIKNSNQIRFIIYFLYLVHIAGVFGIMSPWRELFLDLTPFTILLTTAIIIYALPSKDRVTFSCLSAAFVIGFIAEYLGVNYGLIFGDYHYGTNLGPKIGGVPPIIGINWAILTYCTAVLTSYMIINPWIRAITGALIMTGIDLFIEPVAPKVDFWFFDAGVAQVQNYIGWFSISFLAQIIFQKSNFSKNFYVANNVLVIQTLFFVILNVVA